ncbi:MAG TPA: universal stress protein [Alphaproteobacteria bacterium]|nr:universal stress protein [Alphaproteobacteria bacterium]
MYKHILIPTDGSELSNKAVRYGIALAKAVNAKVTGITVTAPYHLIAMNPEIITDTADTYEKHTAAATAKYLAQVKDSAAAAGVSCTVMHLKHEHPYQAIIDAANKSGCDLIAMASHGRRGVSAVVLGSETVKVLTHSNVPVLVYR